MTLDERLANARESDDLFSDLPSANRKYNKLMADISVKIKMERIKKGLNQKEFADYMDVTQGMVSRWESAEYNFTFRNIVDIFDKLGVNFNISFDEITAEQENDNIAAYFAAYAKSAILDQQSSLYTEIAIAG